MSRDASIEVLKSLPSPDALANVIDCHYMLGDVCCRLIKSTMRDTYLVTAQESKAVAAGSMRRSTDCLPGCLVR